LARNAAARRIVVGGALALGAAFVLLWLVGRAVDQSHTEALDVRLLADLQVARTAFDDDVARAARRANDVAHLSRVEVALAANDGAALRALAATHPGVALVAAGGATGGSLPTLGVTRTVPVVSGGHTIGRVVTAAALDSAYVERARAALPTGTRDLLVVTNGGKVAAGPLPAGTEIPSGSAQDVRVDGRRYRALSTQLVRDRPELRVAVLSPHHASFVSAWRLPLAALATLVAFAALALALYVLPRLRERPAHDDASLTRPAQAAEQKEASGLARIGETLAAANDADALLRVILDAAIKATGAAGGRIARPGDPVARVGESGSELLLVPLDTNEPAGSSSLVLYPPPNGFGAGAADVARWLGLQASTAIKNARFQRVGQEQSLTDDLTGLATRRHFTAALHREFTDAERLSAPLAVLLGDLDDFKRVNDRLGHQAGDEVLKAFARTLRRCVRDIDVPARIGGEEFAVLLPQTDAEGARLFAERLRTELRAEPELPDFVTASFGVAAFPEAGSAEDLLIGADTSLHRAKEAGKDRVVVAAPLEKG
jgi:diguanylate cyclase (GGDEF)-like protein